MDRRQIVLDTETTGLEVNQGHRIIEIGCVELLNRRVTGRHYHQYLHPERDIDAGAMEVHGITLDFLMGKPTFQQAADEFIEFIRGVPLITLLFVANVVLAYFLPPGTNFDLILRVIIMITLFSAAYIAEVIRGGLAALPAGQYEAAGSLGLDYAQSMRLIILPQALKISIPGIVNVAVGLFKDTTLVSIISMFDLVGMIRGPILASTEWNGIYWELLGFAAVLFFIVCYGISQYSQWLERQLATDHR